MEVQKYDYIIVGQGLVGSILALNLLNRNKRILVIDDGHKTSSSTIAAGIVNPITGRSYVKSWMIDTLLQSVKNTYSSIAKKLDVNIFHNREVKRVLFSVKNENAWLARYGQIEYRNYMSENIEINYRSDVIHNQGSLGTVLGGGQLDTRLFLKKVRHFLESSDSYLSKQFDHEQLVMQADYISYHNRSADKLIFAEGHTVINNPFFKYLPFDPVKGEALIIYAPDLKLNVNYRDSIFISPLGDDTFWCGAGYNKQWIDDNPSQSEYDRIAEILAKVIKCDYKIIDHRAGIRPATKTRKPLIGQHPVHKSLYICNGMGAKGTSLAPYLCNRFLESLEGGQAFDIEECNIDKYAQLYSLTQ